MTRFGWMFIFSVGVASGLVALALGAFGMSPGRALFVAMNVATMLGYGYDKVRARAGLERVPELALHLLSVCGGTPGAWLGQMLFRHKTRDRQFRLIFFAIVAIQVIVLFALARRPGL